MKNVNICNENLAYSARASIQNVSEIKLETVMSYLEILPIDGDEVVAEFYLNDKTQLARFNINVCQRGSVLHITLDKASLFLDLFSITTISTRVFIPKSYINTITISGASLDIWGHDIENIALFKAEIASGKCQLFNIASDCVKVSSISGGLQLAAMRTDDLSINSTSGSMLIEKTRIKNSACQNSAINIESISGKVFVEIVDSFDKVSLSAISGSINLRVPSDYKFTSDCGAVSGKVRSVSVNTPPAEHNNNRQNSVKISAISGSITIEN